MGLNSSSSYNYYPPWLTDAECGNEYKQKLIVAYYDFYQEQNKQIKKQKLDDLRIYLTIVSDVVAYRYLVKYYSNLFHKLNITVEEYLDYKVERMYVTLRDKKEKIEDIMSYVYMSFMLSSPRLIYDYGEKIGRCKLTREILPYFQVQRLKFFFIERDNMAEHIVYNVDNIDLDEDSEAIRSNMEKYSLSKYNREQSEQETNFGFNSIVQYLSDYDVKFVNSKKYLLNIFNNWKSGIEDDYLTVKQNLNIKDNFSMFDYIAYKYSNKQTNLNYDEYIEVLGILNKLLKGKRDVK